MEEISTSLVKLLETFTTRGATVLALQLLLMVTGGVAAFFIHRYSHKSLVKHLEAGDLSRLRSLLLKIGQRLAFPLSGLLVVLVGQLVFHQFGFATPLLNILAKLLVALAIVRLIVYALRVGIAPGPGLKAWEKIISTSVWGVVALHLVGWLPAVAATMDQLAIGSGDHRVSLLMATKFVVLSARVGIGKISKFALLTVAIILALTEAGVNLASLTVFGGALGVGIGFGLQKIVSNFISGFILLGDRSISPGDVISVGTNYGWVKELRARYIVVRNRDGVETLIPNENLVTTDVINWSYSDRRVRVRIPVQISYDDDPEQAMAILEQAATVNSRVLKSPEPAVRLMEFADSGIALELRVWMTDPEEGVGNVRSDINLAIWHGFKEAGITIPYPQRDVHLRQVVESG
jgi:small-conductance mechanosensitive channel